MADETNPRPQSGADLPLPPPPPPSPTVREPVVASREEGQPASEPEGTRRARAEEGRAADPAGTSPARPPAPARVSAPAPARTPAPVHARPASMRHDGDLPAGDVVETTIRPGRPAGGWIDVEASCSLSDLRGRKEEAAADLRGINLIAAYGDPVNPDVLREMGAGSLPCRLVRRTRRGT